MPLCKVKQEFLLLPNFILQCVNNNLNEELTLQSSYLSPQYNCPLLCSSGIESDISLFLYNKGEKKQPICKLQLPLYYNAFLLKFNSWVISYRGLLLSLVSLQLVEAPVARDKQWEPGSEHQVPIITAF